MTRSSQALTTKDAYSAVGFKLQWPSGELLESFGDFSTCKAISLDYQITSRSAAEHEVAAVAVQTISWFCRCVTAYAYKKAFYKKTFCEVTLLPRTRTFSEEDC